MNKSYKQRVWQPTVIISPVWNDIFLRTAAGDQATIAKLVDHRYSTSDQVALAFQSSMTKCFNQSVIRLFPPNNPNPSLQTIKQVSDELEGLIDYYEDDLTNAAGNIHIFLALDTHQSRKAAEIMNTWARAVGLDSRLVYIPYDGDRSQRFSMKWFLTNLPSRLQPMIEDYRDQGYKVIFNLRNSYSEFLPILTFFAILAADGLIHNNKKKTSPDDYGENNNQKFLLGNVSDEEINKYTGGAWDKI